MNYYDVLGVPHTATQEEIRRSYRAQIKFFHPDVFRESEAVAKIKTQQLNQAYSVLSDPAQRAQYDDKLRREHEARKAANEQRKAASEPHKAASEPHKAAYEPRPVYKQHDVRTKKRTSANARTKKVLVAAIAAAMCFAFVVSSKSPQPKPAQPADNPYYSHFDDGLTYTEPAKNKTEQYYDLQDEYAVPVSFRNGQIITRPFGECVCPLGVEVRGDSAYYIYLEHIGFGGSDMSFMVSADSSVEVEVPLGEYNIFYATGDTWYGPDLKFGADTQFYQCDDTFLFYEDGQYYQGYTLELYLQDNGNLETDRIDASAFPG